MRRHSAGHGPHACPGRRRGAASLRVTSADAEEMQASRMTPSERRPDVSPEETRRAPLAAGSATEEEGVLDLLEDVTGVIRDTLGASSAATVAAGRRISGVVAELEALEQRLLTEFADFEVLFRRMENARASMPTVAEEDISWIAQKVVQLLVVSLSSTAEPSDRATEGLQAVLSAGIVNPARVPSSWADPPPGRSSPAQQEDVVALDDRVLWARVRPPETGTQ